MPTTAMSAAACFPAREMPALGFGETCRATGGSPIPTGMFGGPYREPRVSPAEGGYGRTLAADVLKSSAIEGEMLNPEKVRSSVARHLGLDAGGLPVASREVEGVVGC